MPAPRLKCKRASRPRPLSEAEAERNTVLHLQYGYGCERIWPDDEGYQLHHRELTVAVLRRLWPEHRQKTMASWRDPGQRPFGWWLCDAPSAARHAYLEAWRSERCWRMTEGADEPDESMVETQARLLAEHGLLTNKERATLAPTLGGDLDDRAHEHEHETHCEVESSTENVPMPEVRVVEHEDNEVGGRLPDSPLPGLQSTVSIDIDEAQ